MSAADRPVTESGADFSDCGTYRYRLWRIWDMSLPLVLWIMLNPSVASAEKDDPTIRRCNAFARSWGAGGNMVVNLFGLISSDPEKLYEHPDPVGPDNDVFLFTEARCCVPIIAAWGAGGSLKARGARVRRLLGERGIGLHHIGLSPVTEQPKHPLARGKHRVPDDQRPIPWGLTRAR